MATTTQVNQVSKKRKVARTAATLYAIRLQIPGERAKTKAQVNALRSDLHRVGKIYNKTAGKTKFGAAAGKGASQASASVYNFGVKGAEYAAKHPKSTTAAIGVGVVAYEGYKHRDEIRSAYYKRRLKSGKQINVRRGRRGRR